MIRGLGIVRWFNGVVTHWLVSRHIPDDMVIRDVDGPVQMYLRCTCGEEWPCRVIRKLSG